MAKKRLKDKILNVANKYDNDTVIKHAELRNIYYGRDKEAKRSKQLHTLKSRYKVAEDYVKNKAGSLSAEERKYITDLALAFTDYDSRLDRKRKSENYKRAVTEVRKTHVENTLGSMVNEYSKESPSLEKTELKREESGRLENHVKEDDTKSGLLSRLSKHYKCMIVAAALFVAGAVGGYYYHKQQLPQKSYTIVLPQKEPEKEITKKPENKKIEKKYVAPKEEKPVIKEAEKANKEPEKKEEQVQEKKPSLEESLNGIDLKYGTVPINKVEKHIIDHKAQKILGHTLKTYTVKDEKVKDSLSYSVKDMYLELLRAMEKNADIGYLHVKGSKKGILPVLEIEFSNKEHESISEHDTGKHDRNNGFLTNTSIINFDGKPENSKGYDLRIKLEGSPEEKALKALKFIQKEIHNSNSHGFFHTYWDKRDKNQPVVEGHMIYTDKENDENFKLKGVLFTQQGTKIEVVNNDEDIKVGEEEQHPSP